MKRVYYPYELWEEVKYGMYKAIDENSKALYLEKAIELLSNPKELELYMQKTVLFWPYSTERNFTTPGLNKQAWLGQAACCLYAEVPESITKDAWSLLSDKQRKLANEAADRVYAKWEKSYAKNI